MDRHLQHLKVVIELLAEHHLEINLSKFEYAEKKVTLLEYLISSQGMTDDPQKVAII